MYFRSILSGTLAILLVSGAVVKADERVGILNAFKPAENSESGLSLPKLGLPKLFGGKEKPAGTVEMAHTTSYYYLGKDPTYALGTTIPFGLNARQQNAWLYRGNGLKLLNDFYATQNLHTLPAGNTGAQMGGWFRKEINTLDDLKGLKCPLPVLKTRKRLEQLPAGAALWIETTDPLAVIDIPHFCNEQGHALEASEKTAGGHRFLIRKKP